MAESTVKGSGVVVHGISSVAGYGLGVTALMASTFRNIAPEFNVQSNLRYLLDLR